MPRAKKIKKKHESEAYTDVTGTLAGASSADHAAAAFAESQNKTQKCQKKPQKAPKKKAQSSNTDWDWPNSETDNEMIEALMKRFDQIADEARSFERGRCVEAPKEVTPSDVTMKELETQGEEHEQGDAATTISRIIDEDLLTTER
jgi:hypothetical protein